MACESSESRWSGESQWVSQRADEPLSEQMKPKMSECTGRQEGECMRNRAIETTLVVESEVERTHKSKTAREREAERVSTQEVGRLKA